MVCVVTKSKENQLLSLWQSVFCDSPALIHTFFRYFWESDGVCLADIEKDSIVSACYLLPASLLLHGEYYPVYYLYGAATHPAYRRQGRMRRLLEAADQLALYSQKCGIFLVPAEERLFAYYQKLGYQICSYRWRVNCSRKKLTDEIVPLKTTALVEDSLSLPFQRVIWEDKTISLAKELHCLDGGMIYSQNNCFAMTLFSDNCCSVIDCIASAYGFLSFAERLLKNSPSEYYSFSFPEDMVPCGLFGNKIPFAMMHWLWPSLAGAAFFVDMEMS